MLYCFCNSPNKDITFYEKYRRKKQKKSSRISYYHVMWAVGRLYYNIGT